MSEVIKFFQVTTESGCYTYDDEIINDEIVQPSRPRRKEKKALDNMAAEQRETIIRISQSEAQKTIDSANAIAQKIIEKASAEAKEELEKAKKTGYDEGFEQGKQEAQVKCESGLNELAVMMDKMESKKSEMLATYESEIRELALSVAEKVIGCELEKNDEAFMSLYKKAVQEIKNTEWLKVMVSECEVSFATANAELLLSMVKDAKEIKIVPLENAPRGTLLVETAQNVVDAGVNTQIKRLRKTFGTMEYSVGVNANG